MPFRRCLHQGFFLVGKKSGKKAGAVHLKESAWSARVKVDSRTEADTSHKKKLGACETRFCSDRSMLPWKGGIAMATASATLKRF